jgi:hypothetical protein
VRIIACLEDPDVIDKVLAHVEKKYDRTPRLMVAALSGAAAARIV